MATWILVPCLVSLRNEFNKLAPSRDKASDGSIGDTSHAAGSSDHNPDETGNTPSEDSDRINEVHAIDVDTDLKKTGWDMQRCVDIIVDNHRAGRDNRLQNVIYNRRIASASWGWTWRDYTGVSPHTEHAHFSARYTTAQENDQSPWGLVAAEEDDMPTASEVATEVVKQLEAARGQAAIGKAVIGYRYGSKSYPNRVVGDFLRDLHAERDDWVGDGKGATVAKPRAGSFAEILRATPGRVDAITKAVAAIASNVVADDGDRKAILDAIAAAQKATVTATAEAVLDQLGGAGSDAAAAELLVGIYGHDRAAAIGDLLTAKAA
ncbi:hypothetical protein [Winogradskya humida]|uniref:Uncharacterized protein n=1 Tax=Winogradskya humida TaxID=113566 RepID=A0ABQ4A776_9ACTN|nr:hypothetical protein [Actinoplanes humidus]GIE26703.1 hypothetical protein Ahu01nite_098050 [Actinoplanes humidus]